MSSALSIGAQTVGLASILKEGLRTYQGVDQATLRNIAAVLELGDLLRTSFGPCGRAKLIASSIVMHTVHVTTDAKTILQEAGVFHPAAKLLAEAALRQGVEQGDGTAGLVILCSALLSKAGELVQQGLRPAAILLAYDICGRQLLHQLDGLIVDRILPDFAHGSRSQLSGQLRPLMLTAMGSKAGGPQEASHLADLASEAMALALPYDRPTNFDLDNVRVAKILGGALDQSRVLHALLLPRLPDTTVKQIHHSCKVAVFSCELDLAKTETKGTVVLKSAEQMRRLVDDEEAELFQQLGAIAQAGASVVVTQDRIGDLALHVLDRLGLVALRLPSKFDIRRLCRATGAHCHTSLTPPPPSHTLGSMESLSLGEFGADQVSIIDIKGAISTIVLRGSSQSLLDDHERCILGGLAVSRAVLLSHYRELDNDGEAGEGPIREQRSRAGALVCGAGACEAELAKRLRDWVDAIPQAADQSASSGASRLAMRAFCEALLSIPEALAENAGLPTLDAVAALEKAHLDGRMTAGLSSSTTITSAINAASMLIEDTPIRDVFECKREMLRMAVKVACLLLSVEQIFMAKPAPTGAPVAANRPASLDVD
jgi:T-complex protein 1 subunit theta